ncbi:uncharacterized protein LOC141857747 [Brevipalpus obovatus]|uniref:uncharacterized protein LOC141857747 n=1 Tax=Brevipalpus obovatus TaxID=246614 RepID=UPI003D9E4165
MQLSYKNRSSIPSKFIKDHNSHNHLLIFCFSCILLMSNVHPVCANYCDHDLCSSQEYCCGDNLCCIYTNFTYYLWLVLVIVMIILSLCWASFHLYYGDLRHYGERPLAVRLIDKLVEIFPPSYKSTSSHLVPSSPKESTKIEFPDDSDKNENGNNDSIV